MNTGAEGWGQELKERRGIKIDPADPRGIVWLASFPRSGNTWTRIFLTNLRRVLDRDPKPLDINHLDPTFSFGDAAAPLYEAALGYSPVSAAPDAIAAVRPKVLQKLVEGNKGIFLLKTHNANAAVYGVRFIPPEVSAGAIYVVRNPLDVVVSNAAFRSLTIDRAIADIGSSGLASETSPEQVYQLIGSWSENVMTWTAVDDPALLVVRYEDMIERPTETFGQIADHVMMKYTPEQLAEAIERSSFAKLKAQEERSGFREKLDTADRFFREGRSGQWREKLTPEQVQRVVADHGQQMERFGYLPQ